MRLLGALFYRLMQVFGLVLRVTPTCIKSAIGTAGAFLWLDVVGFRRRVVLLNLAFAFPRNPEESSTAFKERIYTLARANLKNYFLGFFEVLEKTTWSYETFQKKVTFEGIEHIHKVMADGKGAFFLGSHMGNWEVNLALSRWVGKPLSVIVRYVRNSFWDEALKLSREKFEVNLLPEQSSGVAALRAYKKGHMVAFVLDQHTGEPHGVLARFFGLKAWSAKGLAILSSRLNAKILPLYTYRANGKINVVVLPPMEMDDLGECREDAQILEHVQRCNNMIESWVRKYPDQYFWIHRRFKAHFDYKTEKLPFP
ncbi:MAG: lysophospholipid acyltransferase family protein [Bdellovibrionota bacterium]